MFIFTKVNLLSFIVLSIVYWGISESVIEAEFALEQDGLEAFLLPSLEFSKCMVTQHNSVARFSGFFLSFYIF